MSYNFDIRTSRVACECTILSSLKISQIFFPRYFLFSLIEDIKLIEQNVLCITHRRNFEAALTAATCAHLIFDSNLADAPPRPPSISATKKQRDHRFPIVRSTGRVAPIIVSVIPVLSSWRASCRVHQLSFEPGRTSETSERTVCRRRIVASASIRMEYRRCAAGDSG